MDPERSRKAGRLFKWAGLCGVAAVAIAVVSWQWACDGCLREVALGAQPLTPSLLGAAGDAEPAASQPASASPAAAARTVAQVEEAVFVKGSLQGTQFPEWGVTRDARLLPNRALRVRFDHYLLGLGEASLAELTALMASHAERDLGTATATEVRGVWDRYVALQQRTYRHAANPADPTSVQLALQEHRQARQEVLGLHWAQAFYGEEEAVLAAQVERPRAPADHAGMAEPAWVTPPSGTDPQALHQQRVERFGAEAALRMQALDAEDAAWEQRLARSRAEVEAIRRNPSYSPAQRDEAVRRHLEAAYPDPNERLRAGSLI